MILSYPVETFGVYVIVVTILAVFEAPAMVRFNVVVFVTVLLVPAVKVIALIAVSI